MEDGVGARNNFRTLVCIFKVEKWRAWKNLQALKSCFFHISSRCYPCLPSLLSERFFRESVEIHGWIVLLRLLPTFVALLAFSFTTVDMAKRLRDRPLFPALPNGMRSPPAQPRIGVSQPAQPRDAWRYLGVCLKLCPRACGPEFTRSEPLALVE